MPATQMQKRVAFKNVLFATDFSAAANAAMPFAAGLAKSFGASLYAMYVQEPVNYALPPEAWQGMHEREDEEMKYLCETIGREFPETKPKPLIGEGLVWPALESAIKEHGVDLIVVGTRGRTGVGKALLGSQAEEILRHAACPVLTVGPHACEQENRKRGKMASILFATDFGPASLSAAPIAVSLAEENQSRLTLLHVVDDREAHAKPETVEFGETHEQKLRALVPEEAHLWCQPHLMVERGNAAETILDAARRTEADLIVLGVRGPEGVPGASTHLPLATAHKVIVRSECPVLTVRERTAK
jgi:nucleotide-binding universal stress UspA family protein